MYTINDMELAWAAGFYDGEGSLCVQATSYGAYPRLSIPQSSDHGEPEVLSRFHSAVSLGGSIRSYPPRKGSLERKRVYLLQITGKECVRVVNLLWPYIGEVKRAQVRAAYGKVRAGYPCTIEAESYSTIPR